MNQDIEDICPQCQSHNRPQAQFCAQCGSNLIYGHELQLPVEHVTELESDYLSTEVPSQLDENSLETRMPAGIAAVPAIPVTTRTEHHPNSEKIRLQFGFQSHVGQIREVNEDSVMTLTMANMFEGNHAAAIGVFAVSDGIGGHEAGEVASRQAIEVLAAGILDRVFKFAVSGKDKFRDNYLQESLEKAVHKANREVLNAKHRSGNDMGATLTAVLIHRNKAIIANVGDSRTYLWRNAELEQITNDHSLVASLIKAGELSPEDIYTHEQKGVIYRSLGNKPQLEVDTFTLLLRPEDYLILCCDGVWEMIRDEGIEAVLAATDDPQLACDEMVRRANAAGGEDNISVVIVAARSA